MASRLSKWVATATAFTLIATFAADASVQDAQWRMRHHRHHIAHGGDIYVHAGRSYLDPGTSAIVGTEDHYSSDARPSSFQSLGAPFTNRGFDLLPDRFNPPGRDSPLIQF